MLAGFIAIGIFLVTQLIVAVWWASSMDTKMEMMLEISKNYGNIGNVLKDYSTKEEVATALAASEKDITLALGFANKELSAVWKRIDGLCNKVNGNT